MQSELFYETANDALGACIQAAGGFKRVAGLLWPSLKPDSAYARLKACLDDGKAEKLTADEIFAIAKMAREKGCHAFAQFAGSELDYEFKPITPEDQAAELQREFIAATNTLRAIGDRLTRLGMKVA